MAIKSVLLIGASGALGSPVLQALLAANFTVTALTRESSSATFPSSVRVEKVPDTYPLSSLIPAFANQDAVISTITTTSASVQNRFVDAALAAGVKRFIPSEFGCDAGDETLPTLLPAVFGVKHAQWEYLDQKCRESGGKMSWTTISTGPFFDWMFTVTKGGFGHVDFGKKMVEVLGDGERKFSSTNLGQIGRAVVGVLQKEEETRNQKLLVHSFRLSQNELVNALGKVTGESWEVVKMGDGKEWVKRQMEVANKGEGDMGAVFNVLWGICVTDTDWESQGKKERFANGLLELEEEDLEGSLREAIAKM